MAQGDLSSTMRRAPGARPAPTFSTVEEAHADLVDRLSGSKPHRILTSPTPETLSDGPNISNRSVDGTKRKITPAFYD
jgi:hypothetical protein